MTDHPPLPDFGDELGLYRLVRWAKVRVRASAWPPAERAAILTGIERQYRAARVAPAAEDGGGEGCPEPTAARPRSSLLPIEVARPRYQ